MRRALALCALLVIVPASPAFAENDVSVEQLITGAAAYDINIAGPVTVRGELVGDFQRRSEAVWSQLNGDAYVDAPLLEAGRAGANVGVGIRIPNELFESLGVGKPGGYRVRGPVVAVTGAWRYHDPDRSGESYLDVTEITLLEPERHLTEGIRWWALALGVALLAIGALPVIRRRRGS